jgi:hypothetical protein
MPFLPEELRLLRLERQEWKAVEEWLTMAMRQSPGESIDMWRERTQHIAYPFSQIVEVNEVDDGTG